MLTPFQKYRHKYAVVVGLSIVVLDALLMLGLTIKTAISSFDWCFIVAAIVAGVSYAGIRDTAGRLAYAGEATKFYRGKEDFKLLERYAIGWRKIAFLLTKPLYPALLLAVIFVALQIFLSAFFEVLLQSVVPSELRGQLLLGAFLLIFLYPISLACLVYFLIPFFAGWKEVQAASVFMRAQRNFYAKQLIKNIAMQDMLITVFISTALVWPLRHSEKFSPLLGYNSIAFFLAALIMLMIVLFFSLLSASRKRLYESTGDLYRLKDSSFTAPVLTEATKSARWHRWFHYILILSAVTAFSCWALGVVYPQAPIELMLIFLLLPVAPIFWIERTLVLRVSFYEAAKMVAEFPLRPSDLQLMGKIK